MPSVLVPFRLKGEYGCMSVSTRNISLLTISPLAVTQLREMTTSGIPRVSVSKGGCAGMSWAMETVPAPLPGDTRVVQDGVELLVSSTAFLWLAGCTVDWKTENFEESFSFVGASEAGRCGCGKSFTPSVLS